MPKRGHSDRANERASERWMKFNFTEALQAKSNFFRALFGAALMLTITLLDYFTPAEIAFAVFYLLPVSYFSWFFRPVGAGLIAAVVSACVWLAISLGRHHGAASVY